MVNMTANPRILLIDSYDSFTYNLAALCKQAIPDALVYILKNDALPTATCIPLLHHFDAVIVGPGPGSPQIPTDIGVVKDIWNVADETLLPVFGVCLGLQSLAVEHGAEIRRLNAVKHGQLSVIHHVDADIFADMGIIRAVRYHSLCIDPSRAPDIIPLAWADDGEENGRVLMALRHATKPFWAVQYHPESTCTDESGLRIFQNFWRLGGDWTHSRGRRPYPWNATVEGLVGPSWPNIGPSTTLAAPRRSMPFLTRTVQMPVVNISRVCELLGAENDDSDFVMLESAAAPGRFSVIACLQHTSLKMTYSVGDSAIRLQRGDDVTYSPLDSNDVWAWLNAFMSSRLAHGGVPEVPFWGGLVGYLSYELGVQTITPLPPRPTSHPPDVHLVFVERSIVVDSHSGLVYIQSLLRSDEQWLDDMTSQLRSLGVDSSHPLGVNVKTTLRRDPSAPKVTLPCREDYISRIEAAKEWLASGDSYELCVTAPTRVLVPKAVSARSTSSSWALYKLLRSRNPAPHSGYIRLHPSTLLSSSPERFLSYGRPPNGICQLRPIKGTVRKVPDLTRAAAEEMLLGSKKEVAENLMIVDLIRHDLHSVVGEDVHVKQFCAVEEYETVWQLVSVIEGRPSGGPKDSNSSITGWDVLRSCLPPGSMTGAPKKRSVEILHQLEGEERSVYSGVVGYADVGGGGDWAVVIRSCFKYEKHQTTLKAEEDNLSEIVTDQPFPHSSDIPHGPSRRCTDEPTFDEWTLGAGGAITSLSDPVAEWEEMITKVESVLPAFGDLALH